MQGKNCDKRLQAHNMGAEVNVRAVALSSGESG